MRRRRYSAKLSVLCTGMGTHHRTGIATVMLDPVVEGTVVEGVVVDGLAVDALVACPTCSRTMTVPLGGWTAVWESLLESLMDTGRVSGQHDISRS